MKFVLGGLSGLAVLAAGCSTTGGLEVGSFWGPAAKLSGASSTYDWEEREGSKGFENPEVNNALRASIDQHMAAKGFRRETKARPDLWVRYRGGKYIQQAESGFQSWDEGALGVEILDPGSGGLIWRGTAKTRIDYSVSPDKLRKRIDQIVQRILSNFTPGSPK